MSETEREQELRDLCFDAVMWLDVLGQGDAMAIVDETLDRVVKQLRADSRMPRLSREAWDLMLADARGRAVEDLTALISGKASVAETIHRIVEELVETEAMSGQHQLPTTVPAHSDETPRSRCGSALPGSGQSQEHELLRRMSDMAFELIKIIELERSGIRDGDGCWSGSDPMGGAARELAGLIEEYERRTKSADDTPPITDTPEWAGFATTIRKSRGRGKYETE